MANLVNNFMENLNEPVAVQVSDTFSNAIEKMLDNDFSQLPVVDDQNKPIGFRNVSKHYPHAYISTDAFRRIICSRCL